MRSDKSMSHAPDLVQALSSLPHGKEFRFIDQLTSLVPGDSASATWMLKGDEEFLHGHFPGHPLLPGVIMIEALAQLGGILTQTRPGIPSMPGLRLTAVKQFKILGSITPGESLVIHARIEGALGNVVQVSGDIISASGLKLASGVVVLGSSGA